MFVLTVLIGILALFLFYYLWNRRRFYLLSLYIPTLFGLPFLGVLFRHFRIEDFLNNLNKHSEKLGHIYMMWMGPVPAIITDDPDIIEKILTSPDCLNKAYPYKHVTDIVGEGLFSSSTPQWNMHRKLLNPTFSHKILLDFFPIFNRGTDVLRKQINEHVDQGEFDITEYLQKASLNIAARTTMGKEMCSELPTDSIDLLGSFQAMLKAVIIKIVTPWYQIDTLFQLSNCYSIVQEGKLKMHDFVNQLIQDKVSHYNSNSHVSTNDIAITTSEDVGITKPKNIFIDHAIDLALKNQFSWDDVETECLVIVFAAFETTSSTLFFTLVCLAMFPSYQERLFEEIVSVIPDKNSDVTFEHIQAMKYMEMVLNETLRVMTPVPLVGRMVSKDLQINENITLPEGIQVIFNVFNLHRRKDIWGSNADVFNPDNFLPTNMEGKHPYAFIPFSKGLRNCIGWRYAYFAVKVILSRLLRNYRFTTSFNFQDLEFEENVTLKLGKNPLLEVHRRSC